MSTLEATRRRALAHLIPPPRIDLATWMEREIRIPASMAAVPGRIRLHKWQRGVCDAISDPAYPRVSVQKSARVGFTTVLIGALGSTVANDPAPTLLFLPVLEDCQNFMRDFWTPISEASPALRGVLSDDREGGARNTMLSKRFAGGSLHIVPARSPRNFRSKPARNAFFDEVDAYEVSNEGDPIALGIKRTEGFRKKILMGGTPVDAETSRIVRAYEEGDGRVFECVPPCCGVPVEIRWEHIRWPEGRPDLASFECPACKERVDHRHKAAMIEAGEWRATRPEVKGHASFRINSLISLSPDMTWAAIAADFLKKKRFPDTLKTFVNLTLGEPWRNESESLDENEISSRAEPFSIESIPIEVLWVTAGVDVGRDRLDATLLGHDAFGGLYALDHRTLYGMPADKDDGVWLDLESILRETWPHPLGGRIGVSAAAIDSGDGATMDAVHAFTRPRWKRRVFSIKGDDGNRARWTESKSQRGRLFIVGTDGIKDNLYDRIRAKSGLRFSHLLEPRYYEELIAERRKITVRMGKEKRTWDKPTGARVEAWDCLVYGWAVRDSIVSRDLAQRENELRGMSPATTPSKVTRMKWISGES